MIYFAEAVGIGNIKIGFTDGDDAQIRIAMLQTGCPVPIRLLGTIPGTLEDEKDLHRRFAANRVNGEWFQPVPELLAIIPDQGQRQCGAIETVTRTIQIRVLTVGRKQLSKTLLAQLPRRNVIDWCDFLPLLSGDPLPSVDALRQRLHGDVWGWVIGGSENVNEPLAHPQYVSYRNVLWEKDGSLFVHQDFVNLFHEWAYSLGRLAGKELAAANSLTLEAYGLRRQLPNWENQLFIGV